MKPLLRAWNLPIGQVAAAAWIIASMALGALAVTLQLRDRSGTLETFADLRAYSANAAADTVNRIFGTMDILFSQAMDDWRRAGATVDQLYLSLSDSERRIGRAMLAFDTFAIVSLDGRLLFSPNPASVGVYVGDREYFTVHRDGVHTGMWIGQAVLSRVTPGERRLPVSWAILDAAGALQGILWASVSPEVLSQVLFNYRDTEDSFVALVSKEGSTLATDRRHRSVVIPAPVVAAAATGEKSSTIANVAVDGVHGTWQLAARTVGGTGLKVVLGATEEQMLEGWYVRSITIAALILFVVIFLGAFTVAILRLAVDEHLARRQAEDAARRATQADLSKTEFLAVMSHEIRTPLTAIIGMAELLSTAKLEEAEQRRVEAIRTGGRQMLTVVNDVLDFTRLGAGAIELERIPFALPVLVDEVRSTMGPTAQSRGLTMDVDISRAPGPWLMGDPNRLRQVLLNLVGNAVKFTEAGGIAITVEPGPADDGTAPGARLVRFTVADTGIGIPADRMDRLFQPFSQADSSMARRYGGSGLGLAICKRLVDAMGGRIGVDSAPDAGSRFTVDIPLESAEPKGPADAAEAETRARPLSLLVAEDVEINRELVRAVMTARGHRVTLVPDGAAALEAVLQERFDAVLMDIQMPVMDGVEATRRIRGLPGPERTVPIVALTANVLTGARQSYLAAGMTACVDKPISWTELDRTLARITAPPSARNGGSHAEK